MIVTLAGSASAQGFAAEECRSLSEGWQALSYDQTCYTFVDLSVRRGAPPTSTTTDCESAQHTLEAGMRFGGPETCQLDLGSGPVYAFVTFAYFFEPPYPETVGHLIPHCNFVAPNLGCRENVMAIAGARLS